MKKAILALVLLSSMASYAQDNDPAFTNKRGVDLLPVAGDWGLGANAVPFLNYLGNSFNGSNSNFGISFNGSNSNDMNFGFLNADQTIFGKYFLTDGKAIRGAARIGYSSINLYNPVPSMQASASPIFVEDRRQVNTSNYMLSGGLEFRRGHGRVQGYYGAEAFVGFASTNVTYEYGNALTASNPSVFFTDDWSEGGVIQDSERTVEERSGMSTMFGVRGFVGVEYFFAPRISLAGEFGWGPAFMLQGEGTTLQERIDNNQLERRELPSGSQDGFSIDNDNLNGSIALMFYF
jgi:hypothetical protein